MTEAAQDTYFDLGVESEGGMDEVESEAPDSVAAVEAEDDAQAVEADDTGDQDGPGAEAPTPYFTFKLSNGQTKTFSSEDEANQYFATWNGRLSKQAEVLKEYQEENQRWAEWFDQNKSLVEATMKAEQQNGKAETPESDLLKQADWNYVQELIANGQQTKAIQYLAYKSNEFVKNEIKQAREALESQFNEFVGPMQEQREIRNTLSGLLNAAQLSADEYGNPTFPEFQENSPSFDPDFVTTFSQVLASMPVDLALRPDGEGIAIAYDRAQLLQARREATKTETTSKAGQALRDAQGRFAKNTEARATAIGGSKPTAPSEREPGSGQSIAEFKRALSNAGKRDDFLGVEYD